MIKKAYIKPTMQVEEILHTSIICISQFGERVNRVSTGTQGKTTEDEDLELQYSTEGYSTEGGQQYSIW